MKDLSFLKTYCSPFKPLKLKWYVGKIAVGTPYFYPRRWVNDKDKPGYLKPVPKKIGFDFVRLGWKTKWSSNDYRFEWSPLVSFVFFKWQVAVVFKAPEQDHYWEMWLYYENDTDKSKSKADRIEQCRKENPQIWTSFRNGVEEKVDYYDRVLRKKYIKE
jgi:hypothetical protein